MNNIAPTFAKQDNLKFFRTLNSRVNNYFKENKIQYETKIAVPDKLDISSYNLNIILGNLLDNSVQSTILTQAPSINIRIEYKTGILYIYVSNSCLENSVTYKNNKIINKNL